MSAARSILVYVTGSQLCMLPSWHYSDEETEALKRVLREAFDLTQHYQVDQTLVRLNEPYRLSIPLPTDGSGELFGVEAAKRHIAQHLVALQESLCMTIEVM